MSVPLSQELSEKTIRTITTRLNKFKEFILDKFSNTDKKTKTGVNSVHNEMLKKYTEDKTRFDLYQGLLERHKVLYAIKLDLHELKCFALRLMDYQNPMPVKPKFSPLPVLDIKQPQAPAQQMRADRKLTQQNSIRYTQDQENPYKSTLSKRNVDDFDRRSSKVTFDNTMKYSDDESDSELSHVGYSGERRGTDFETLENTFGGEENDNLIISDQDDEDEGEGEEDEDEEENGNEEDACTIS